MTRSVVGLLAGTFIAGCSFVDHLPGRPIPPVVAALEVFNRTEQDIFYVGADGERLDIPACARAVDKTSRIEAVHVRAEDGYIRGFGAGDPELAGRRVVVVELARTADSSIPAVGPPPEPLPACRGLPDVQEGV